MSSRRHISIFTTASLPWMTGTATNPLFRAAYLAKSGGDDVTLVVPWLCESEQRFAYPNPNNIAFDFSWQASYVRKWIESRIDFPSSFRITFYEGKLCQESGIILPVGDITKHIPHKSVDIAVVEEPQYLLRDRHGGGLKKRKFKRVIGIVHTNCVSHFKHGNNWLTYCHEIIRLSGAIQHPPRSVICNVHGVIQKFLEVGKLKSSQLQSGENAFMKGAYYIGEMVCRERFRKLLSKLCGLAVDLYLRSEDFEDVYESVKLLSLAKNVPHCRDHSDPMFHEYKVFVNPSTTNEVCKTTAEALAMGKIVVCANHPSNEFFKQFPNCRICNNDEEFVRLALNALSEQPAPLTDMQRYELSWEAATKRFVEAAGINPQTEELTPLTDMQRYNQLSWEAATGIQSRVLI